MRSLVIIPTYNERDNLAELVRAVLPIDPAIDILVVDDNSPDGTGLLADQLAIETGGRVKALHRGSKQGLGTAYVAGFRFALVQGYDQVVEMDADFSHRPEDLPRLLDAAGKVDVVIGSRNVPGGRAVGWSPLRRAVSYGGSAFARLVLNLPVRDCTSGFKCFRRVALEALDLRAISSNGFGFQIEVNYACSQAGLRFAEVPIEFLDRTRGTSKFSTRIVLEALRLVVSLRAGVHRAPIRIDTRVARSRKGNRQHLPGGALTNHQHSQLARVVRYLLASQVRRTRREGHV